jgi:hypothetical protein
MASADFCILTIPITQRGAVYPYFLSVFFSSYLIDRRDLTDNLKESGLKTILFAPIEG